MATCRPAPSARSCRNWKRGREEQTQDRGHGQAEKRGAASEGDETGSRLHPDQDQEARRAGRGGASAVAQVQAKTDAVHDQPLLTGHCRGRSTGSSCRRRCGRHRQRNRYARGLHHSTVNELLRLTLLEPAIVQAIYGGQQPRCMSLLWVPAQPAADWTGWRSGKWWRV